MKRLLSFVCILLLLQVAVQYESGRQRRGENYSVAVSGALNNYGNFIKQGRMSGFARQATPPQMPIENTKKVSWWWWVIGVVLVIAGGMLLYVLMKKNSRHDVR